MLVLLFPTVICRGFLFPFQYWDRFSDLKLSLLPLRTNTLLIVKRNNSEVEPSTVI